MSQNPNSVFQLPGVEPEQGVQPAVDPEKAYFDTQFSGITAPLLGLPEFKIELPELVSREILSDKVVDAEFAEIIKGLKEVEAIGEAIIEARHHETAKAISIERRDPLSFALDKLRSLL